MTKEKDYYPMSIETEKLAHMIQELKKAVTESMKPETKIKKKLLKTIEYQDKKYMCREEVNALLDYIIIAAVKNSYYTD